MAADGNEGVAVARWGRRAVEVGRLLPGVGLLALGGTGAWWIHTALVPRLGVALPAMALGLLLGSVPMPRRLALGSLATYGLWLRVGVVLLGADVSRGAFALVGLKGLLLVFAKMALALAAARWVAPRLFGPGPARLFGIADAVCGVNAILAAKGRLYERDEEATVPVAAVLLTGAAAVFLAPLVAALHPPAALAGAVAGLGIDNTAEAVAAGGAFGTLGGAVATMFKLTRNAFLGLVVTLAGFRPGGRPLRNLWREFPPFVAGYFALAALAVVQALPAWAVGLAHSGANAAFALAFVGVGLSFRRHLGGRHVRDVLSGVAYLFGTLMVTAVMVILVGP
jgi:uncharacterized membrane protein YadS